MHFKEVFVYESPWKNCTVHLMKIEIKAYSKRYKNVFTSRKRRTRRDYFWCSKFGNYNQDNPGYISYYSRDYNINVLLSFLLRIQELRNKFSRAYYYFLKFFRVFPRY